jgi:hypothetical protein
MNDIYEVGALLGFNRLETSSIVAHWYLAGFMKPEYINQTKEDLQIPEDIHQHILACSNASFGELNASADWEEVFSAAEEFAMSLSSQNNLALKVIALALFQYLQQNHFSKGEAKEVSKAQDSVYTVSHAASILELAKTCDLLEEKKATESADITLIMGATSKTIPVYLGQYQERINSGIPYVFLSTRVLSASNTSDNPYYDEATNDFTTDTTKTSYLNHLATIKDEYDAFLTGNFGKASVGLTEGLAMFERSKAMGINQAVFIYTDSPNAEDFCKAALIQAQNTGNLNTVAITHIQPYIKRYIFELKEYAQALNLGHLQIIGYGGTGSSAAKTLVQALAMLINAGYNNAAKIITQQTGLNCIPRNDLQFSSRTKLRAANETRSVASALTSLGQFAEKNSASSEENVTTVASTSAAPK